MNHTISNLILVCSTILFALLSISLFFSRAKQKKIILSVVPDVQKTITTQLNNHEQRLKDSAGVLLTAELEGKISQMMLLEKECKNKLLLAFLDYHPAAVKLLPDVYAKIADAYIDYIECVLSKSLKKHDNEGDELFQYEALIEQLRHEKHDYADKYKTSQNLLKQIYRKYKDKIGITDSQTLDTMTLNDIAVLFNVEL